MTATAGHVRVLGRRCHAGVSRSVSYWRPHRLGWSRTPDFRSGDTGSNPVGDATRLILKLPGKPQAGKGLRQRLLLRAGARRPFASKWPSEMALRGSPPARVWEGESRIGSKDARRLRRACSSSSGRASLPSRLSYQSLRSLSDVCMINFLGFVPGLAATVVRQR